jgi:RNA polymerase sigma-70 factor (ECF subfamily)
MPVPSTMTTLLGDRVAPAQRSAAEPQAGLRAPASVVQVHAEHGDFVWVSLQRLGARDADLEDLFQEVFVVVHRRLSEFEGRSRVTTWLFGICLRVVAAHRRKAHTRLELPMDVPPDRADAAHRMPDAALARRQAATRITVILDGMDLEKRAVFVMAVLEELPSDEIAAILGVPVGTVYSRLNAARAELAEGLERWARAGRGGLR